MCGFPYLKKPPVARDGDPAFEFCPSCGYHFGVTDLEEGIGYSTWRERWVADGLEWQGEDSRPSSCDPVEQLATLRGDEPA